MKTVAYQGEPGAFSETAARKFFGGRAKLQPMPTFKEVFSYVSRKTGCYGIVPVENSVFGSIHQTYDLLLEHRLAIVGEIKLRIQLHLIGFRGTSLRSIRSVYSQTQALGQCDEFLRKLKNVKIEAFYDTAGSAKLVSEHRDRSAAAIAGADAARMYGLAILKRNIESNHHNYTRFIVLSRKAPTLDRNVKTSLVFAVKDIPGALFKSLAVFALRDVNLLKIESRPLIGKPWEYLFYLDVEGTPRREPLRDALNHLNEVCIFSRILGTYPPGKTIQR